MFRCKHVFFRIFPQFSQYLYLTDSHRVHPTLAEYTHLHAHSQARADTHAHMHKRTHTHTHRINVKKKKKKSRAALSDAPVQLSLWFFFPAGMWRMPVTALSHTHPRWGHPLCNMISGYWLSLPSLTSRKVSPGLMSPVSIEMGWSPFWRLEDEDCQIQTKHSWRHLADPLNSETNKIWQNDWWFIICLCMSG